MTKQVSANNDDSEWNAFASENAKGGGELLFGRITYEVMASYWPTPAAMTLFETLDDKLPLKETKSRTFKNGNVLVCYEPTR
jgi:dihydrofolate reductase